MFKGVRSWSIKASESKLLIEIGKLEPLKKNLSEFSPAVLTIVFVLSLL